MKAVLVCLLIVACASDTFADSQTKDVKPKKTAKNPIQEDKGVLVLRKSNFDQALRQYKQLLVNFYVPLSGEANRLAMEFTKAAAQLKEEESKIQLGALDVSSEKDLAKELNATGLSFMRFYVAGDKQNPVICPALSTAEHIVTWLKRKTGQSAEVIKTVSQAEAFLMSEELVILGFFKELDEGKVEMYYEAAIEVPDLPFGVTKSKHVFAKYDIAEDAVVLFRKSKKVEEYVVSSETQREDVVIFIRINEMDLVTEYSGTTSGKVLNFAVTNHALLFANKSEESFRVVYSAFEKAAMVFRGKVFFVFLNTDEHRNGRMLEYFRIRYIETPMVRIVNMTDSTQYIMQTDEITMDNIKAHCQQYLDRNAKPKLQSEPVPKNWDKKAVKELVGMNFEKVAFNDRNDVFVMFYTPWCKECLAFFPLLEKLGKVYEKHNSVVIARIDSVSNDVNVVLEDKYPSFKFFPAVFSEKVVLYSGKRTLEDFIEFVEEQVELAKDLKAKEKIDRDKYIEEKKQNERIKVEL